MRHADLQRAYADPVVRLTHWLMVRLDVVLPPALAHAAWNWLCDVQAARFRKHLGLL